MLTGPQTTLHWRRWSACADANDWVMQNQRLSADARRTEAASIYHRLVWKTARELSLQRHGAITADDLRHSCYLVATTKVPGWPQRLRPVDSMKDLDNRTFSRWLALIDLLIEPDNLDATIKWEHPEQGARETLLASLRKAAPEATVRAIAGNAFGTHDWESLDAGQLAWLRRKLGERQKKWSRPVEQPF